MCNLKAIKDLSCWCRSLSSLAVGICNRKYSFPARAMGSHVIICLAALLGAAVAQLGPVGYVNPACDGKQVIVHLFEWKWTDIALECERFLAQNGYCGVQVSPPNEHLVIPPGGSEPAQPWWQRYQPISYTLHSRSGTEEEFVDMVQRCNAVGVRIFVDAIVNHMAAQGRSGTGSAGTFFDADQHDFPGVPYGPDDFTPRDLCPSGDGNVNDYSDADNVRNCNLVALSDLYGATDSVRQKVAAYFSDLVNIGVAGFRVDAAKHMWPEDLLAMEDLTVDLNTEQGFPAGTRPFFYHEVIDRDDGVVTVTEYYDMGRITEFRYCQKIAWGIQDPNQLSGVYDPGWKMTDPDKAFVFVDNHDNQRGHGGPGDTLTYQYPHDYRLGVAFTLAQPYGYTRIMSSYDFGEDTDMGPPHNSDYSTDDVVINGDNQCENGWVCEHRWPSISKMARFRNAVAASDSWSNYYTDGNVVAFSRGDLGFFAMVKIGTLSETMQTGMPAGTYEELLTCASITVGADGTADISITNEEEPVFAICQGCTCDDAPTVTATQGPDVTPTTPEPTTQGPTEPSITEGVQRTVIFIQKQATDGQDLFVRGGIDGSVRPGCTDDATTDPCAIDIATNSLGTSTHYDKYNSWRDGDNKLDWFGAEVGQGMYGDEEASGSPLVWTSSDSSNAGYQELNFYGDHYWMLDVDMDCSQAEQGWFEVKAFLTNAGEGWEGDITQSGACQGSAGGGASYSTGNHLGRCGYVNVFTFDSGACIVDAFP